MIQGAAFASTPAPAARPEAAATQNTGSPSEGTTPATANADRAPRQAGAASDTRGARQSPGDHAHATERGGDAFAALLQPAAEPPALPVAVAPATAPAVTAERPAATPDQWLAMLAGALAMPVAVTSNTADATPVAPAGIPTSSPLPTALPPAFAAAGPVTTPTDPALATLPALDAVLDAVLPAADPSAGSGGDGKPAFETLLGGLATPAAPVAAPAVREAAPLPPPLLMPADPSQGFDDGVGSHIAWMAGQKLGEARIQVSPEHLGPIEVTLTLDDARVDAHFHSAHVEVRAALEASVPRLREMLAQHGLQLGQADVGQRHGASQPQGAPAFQSGDGDAGATPAPAAPIVHRRGLLDEYA